MKPVAIQPFLGLRLRGPVNAGLPSTPVGWVPVGRLSVGRVIVNM
jgi:hypothetical protein